MEDIQTENAFSFQKSHNKQRVHVIDDNCKSDDEDFASAGFYVRAKNESKSSRSPDSCDKPEGNEKDDKPDPDISNNEVTVNSQDEVNFISKVNKWKSPENDVEDDASENDSDEKNASSETAAASPEPVEDNENSKETLNNLPEDCLVSNKDQKDSGINNGVSMSDSDTALVENTTDEQIDDSFADDQKERADAPGPDTLAENKDENKDNSGDGFSITKPGQNQDVEEKSDEIESNDDASEETEEVVKEVEENSDEDKPSNDISEKGPEVVKDLEEKADDDKSNDVSETTQEVVKEMEEKSHENNSNDVSEAREEVVKELEDKLDENKASNDISEKIPEVVKNLEEKSDEDKSNDIYKEQEGINDVEEKPDENRLNDAITTTTNKDETRGEIEITKEKSKDDTEKKSETGKSSNDNSTTANSDKNKSPVEPPKQNNSNTESKDTGEKPNVQLPILHAELTKSVEEEREFLSTDQGDDEDMEYEFDPSLLCPDISMDVDEALIITNPEPDARDGNSSPLLYEASFSTYVDEMTGAEMAFNLTPEELNLRATIYNDANPIQMSKIHCTACNVHLGSALDGQKNRFVHPLLKVLICKNCYHFYTSGEFEKDEDGSELYCRWCGQGGQVLCCSSCEFVFCKRCIRNNFSMKIFKEIKNSEDWNCFRCDPQQLSPLRASCAEFMDYVRRETAKAATLMNDVPGFMSVDHTTCCNAIQKKKDGEKTAQPPKRKRKASVSDPDYKLPEEPEEKKVAVSLVAPSPPVPIRPANTPAKPTPMPRPMPLKSTIHPNQPPPSMTFKVGQTQFKPKFQQVGYTIIRPTTTAVSTLRPGLIKVVPQNSLANIRTPVVLSTASPRPTLNVLGNNSSPPPLTSTAKHEWFEKTVRAAARVNSNLSYTLAQLNRKQATANSVESLAMIHNKLQEVLSTSINSLIQIRKNLRSEFIQGIKTVKFPPPKLAPTSVVSNKSTIVSIKDDDDVIFVNSGTSTPVNPPSSKMPLSPSITLTSVKKNTPKVKNNDVYANPMPSTSSTPSTAKTGTYLKVKSLSALQSVSSECITIPDDPLPPPPALTPIKNFHQITNIVTVIDESPEKQDPKENGTSEIVNLDSDIDEDDTVPPRKLKKHNSTSSMIPNGGESSRESNTSVSGKSNKPIFLETVVIIERSKLVEDMVKNKIFSLNNTADSE